MPSVNDCPKHGEQIITCTVSSGDIRHVSLECGCTREYVDDTLEEGDIVMYRGSLFRLEKMYKDEPHAKIANVLIERVALVKDLKRVGPDTISGMKRHGALNFKVGDWVRHREFKVIGEIIEIKHNGDLKVEAYDVMDDRFRYYAWRPGMVKESPPSRVQKAANKEETSRRPYWERSPGQSSYDWGGEKYKRWNSQPSRKGNGGPYNRFDRPKKKKTKPKLDDISTATLIKEEVEQIEKKSRRLKTAAPTLKKPFEGSSPGIPKRKGDWGPSPESKKEEEEEFTPVVPKRRGDW